jgi:hypothetical protein
VKQDEHSQGQQSQRKPAGEGSRIGQARFLSAKHVKMIHRFVV